MSTEPARGGWWAVEGRRFLVIATATAGLTVAVAWGTGLRQAMHAALLSVAVLALFPLLVIGGALLLLLAIGFAVGVAAAVSGGGDAPDVGVLPGGDALVEGGAWLTRRYYRFLARRRHPAFWGAAAGVLAGGLLLAALIAAVVVPGEARTTRVLAEVKDKIERVHRATGRFPTPDAYGHLARAALDEERPSASASAGLVLDGFDRPVRYELSSRWGVASYQLTSLGFDGRPGRDDLCLSGTNRLGRLAAKLEHALHLLDDLRTGAAPLADRLAGIRALRCDPAVD